MATQTTQNMSLADFKDHKAYRLESEINDETGEVIIAVWGMREGKYMINAKAKIEDLPSDFQAVFAQYLLTQGD